MYLHCANNSGFTVLEHVYIVIFSQVSIQEMLLRIPDLNVSLYHVEFLRFLTLKIAHFTTKFNTYWKKRCEL